MIIDWTKRIYAILHNDPDKDVLIRDIEKDIDDIFDAACKFDIVIIRIKNGSRIEISPLYQQGNIDFKYFCRDFKEIYKYNQLKQQKDEAEQKLKDFLKDEPEKLATLQEYLETINLQELLYKIDLVKTANNRTNRIKIYPQVPLYAIKAYLSGILKGIGIDLPNIKI